MKTRECNMRSKQYDSLLWPSTCHKPFSKIIRCKAQTHTHTHTAGMHSQNNCVFASARLQWQYVILTLHSTCQETLFLLPPINWLIFLSFHLQPACARTHLQASLPSIADIMRNRKMEAMNMNMCITIVPFVCLFMNRKMKFKVCKKKKSLSLCASSLSSG